MKMNVKEELISVLKKEKIEFCEYKLDEFIQHAKQHTITQLIDEYNKYNLCEISELKDRLKKQDSLNYAQLKREIMIYFATKTKEDRINECINKLRVFSLSAYDFEKKYKKELLQNITSITVIEDDNSNKLTLSLGSSGETQKQYISDLLTFAFDRAFNLEFLPTYIFLHDSLEGVYNQTFEENFLKFKLSKNGKLEIQSTDERDKNKFNLINNKFKEKNKSDFRTVLTRSEFKKLISKKN
jgi:hypothetical protein